MNEQLSLVETQVLIAVTQQGGWISITRVREIITTVSQEAIAVALSHLEIKNLVVIKPASTGDLYVTATLEGFRIHLGYQPLRHGQEVKQ